MKTIINSFILLIITTLFIACKKETNKEINARANHCVLNGDTLGFQSDFLCQNFDSQLKGKKFKLFSIINLSDCSEKEMIKESGWINDYTITFFATDTFVGVDTFDVKITLVNNVVFGDVEKQDSCQLLIRPKITTDLMNEAYDELFLKTIENTTNFFLDDIDNLYKYQNDTILLKFNEW